uniref:CSON000179 protein n=1 Tax=Culicoides sonorensis TaxID=179676 RepID=A0A336KV53_CULSO
MTATKIDIMASKPMQRCYVKDVQQVVPRVTRRCLFGAPDQDELQKIWNRNLETERQRMINKYGFDVKTEKFVGSHGVSSKSAKSSGDSNKYAGSNRLCNNNKTSNDNKKTASDYKQTCMTDYYSMQKKKNKETDDKIIKNTSQLFSKKNVNKV